ncbi:MAG: hypothetical protein ABF587_03130 [Leuconostoc sp.]|uniref:hypothetical protein n=1 Tax=Leuconostoc sp. TaxID=1930076 RepID=UPI0039E8219C
MKIPIQTPFEQLRDTVITRQQRVHESIVAFRANILSNRDAKHQQRPSRQETIAREVSIVPYEATPKAVDADSFAYALTAEMTEIQAETQHTTRRPLFQSLIQHPIRLLVSLVIVILLVYITIMFFQANSQQGAAAITQPTQIH